MRRLLPVVALGLIAFATAPAGATHAWADYHWARTSNPVQLKINYSVTTDWVARTDAVRADWDQSTVLSLTRIDSDSSSRTRKRCPAISGQLRVCNASYGFNGWLGLATIHIDANHHITDGTEKLNDSYFGLSQYNNEAEKRHVACQEIGHTFGLDHQDTSGKSLNTCMDYYQNTSDTDTKSTTPNQHDYDELVTIYSHTDSYNTATAMISGVPTEVFIDSQTGQLTYVFIFWADPAVTAAALAAQATGVN